jgi:hypothetical protein
MNLDVTNPIFGRNLPTMRLILRLNPVEICGI